MSERKDSGKSAGAFRTISEVSLYLDVPQHVLRFWEGKFSQVSPLKRGGGRRYAREAPGGPGQHFGKQHFAKISNFLAVGELCKLLVSSPALCFSPG